MTIASSVLLTATLVAAALDVRSRRIPNALTGSLALIAVLVHVSEGPAAIAIAIATIAGTFVLGSFAFAAGWFGGGDVKLLAASCGLVSFPGCIALIVYVLIAGATLSLSWAALRGRLVALVRSTIAVAAHGAPTERTALPYGIAIAAGSAFYVASSLVPALRLPL